MKGWLRASVGRLLHVVAVRDIERDQSIEATQFSLVEAKTATKYEAQQNVALVEKNDDHNNHNDHALIKYQKIGSSKMKKKIIHSSNGRTTLEKVDNILKDVVSKMVTMITDGIIKDNLPWLVVDVVKKEREQIKAKIPALGEKNVKRKRTSRGSKFAREIDEDEVIPEDETPELLNEFENVDKRVPTIFDHKRMEATMKDMMSNQFRNVDDYAYHIKQAKNNVKNQIVWESIQKDLMEAACAHHEDHMMHDSVQIDHVVDSHADYTSDSNIILCDQYVKDNDVPVVHSDVSSVPTDAFLMIYDDMCEPHDQSVSYPSQKTEFRTL
nr:hypothetical protein [Tanacetum cinerariifolium]